MEVRDPIHGAIVITDAETRVVDHPFVQRLRSISQVGFSQLPFPGATHSRYSHCMGVMHLAGQAFDSAFKAQDGLVQQRAQDWRACVRLAALCHDLGHPPFSHCAEFAMPALSTLALSWYGSHGQTSRQATHEDYTIAILQHSSLQEVIDGNFGCSARHVAALISHDVGVEDDFFVSAGVDYRTALSQIISSELDVDRLDYLVRDSTYTGARYGQVDAAWLLSNLGLHVLDDHASLSLAPRAIYAFEDFMIARHHMFLMVYFHHKSVVYEKMLQRYMQSSDGEVEVPSDLQAYLSFDDVALVHALRGSSNPWAKRIVQRTPYARVVERHGQPEEVDLSAWTSTLTQAGIDHIVATSTGVLSRYHHGGGEQSRTSGFWVGGPEPKPMREASLVFQRYADARRIGRIYVAPEEKTTALGLFEEGFE